MKKEILLLVLISISALAFMDVTTDAVECVREDNSSEIYYCIQDNYIENVAIKFTDDIRCLSSDTVKEGSMYEIMDLGCFSEVEFTAPKKIELPFLKVQGKTIDDDNTQNVTKEVDLQPGDWSDAVVDNSFVSREDCVVENEYQDGKMYNCGHKGKSYVVNAAFYVTNEKNFIRIFGKGSDITLSIWNFLLQNWLYVLLALIAVFIIYSIVKKQK